MNNLLLQATSEPQFNNELLSWLVASMALTMLILVPGYYLVKVFRQYYPLDLKKRYRPYLEKLRYYQGLSKSEQKAFRKRLQYFINTKKFISRAKNWPIQDEMILRIAAAAVELTFGFRKFSFEHFSKILVYPDDYYSNISKRYHRGEVNLRGFIVLSWKAFEEGYADPEDGINLGVHEMAHALKLENRILNSDHNFIKDRDGLSLEMAYDRLKSGESPLDQLFRSYAKTNIHEFFAVACENFLERPLAFRETEPELYRLMVQILRQDPLAREQRLRAPSAASQGSISSSGPVMRY